MRKLIAATLVAGAAVIGGQAIAADFPEYAPIIEIPDVDYGVQGSFYLRGSAGLNALWAKEVNHPTAPGVFAIDGWGYGYSVGAGFGYETGTGLRFDVTADYLANDGLKTTIPAGTAIAAGEHKLNLRSTVLLANAYYDFGFSEMGYGVAGGAFGYVGAGAGVAFNDVITTPPAGAPADTRDQSASFAAAGMVGVGYDFGQVVADLGYRALYINDIRNDAALHPYNIANSWTHEVRGSLRYRFN